MLNKGEWILRKWTEILSGKKTLQLISNLYYLFNLICSTRKLPNCFFFLHLTWRCLIITLELMYPKLHSSCPTPTLSHPRLHSPVSTVSVKGVILHPGARVRTSDSSWISHPTPILLQPVSKPYHSCFQNMYLGSTHNSSFSLLSSFPTCGGLLAGFLGPTPTPPRAGSN